MISLDTNILARYLLNDDAKQSKAATALLAEDEDYTVSATVILELVWVLRANGCTRAEINKGLRLLLGLPNFKPKEFEALCYAIRWHEQGMDFADALHLALSSEDDVFCTFDKTVGKLAGKVGAAPEVRVL